MRKLILCVAVLALCGAVGRQQNSEYTRPASPPSGVIRCWNDLSAHKKLCMDSTGRLGKVVDGKFVADSPNQEQKAQPAMPMTLLTKQGHVVKPLPFDLPAKEFIEPEWWQCGDNSGCSVSKKMVHRWRCADMPDWKLRSTPIQTGDGKYHCYAFYLLEPKP